MIHYIQYKKGYKYQLAVDYSVWIPIKPKTDLRSDSGFIFLSSEGLLTIKHGYAWDGPSGPAIDTPNFMRSSLVHDALYQLFREGVLHRSRRQEADLLLREHCLEDGMSKVRANWVYWAVNRFAARSSTAEGERQIIKAP